MAARAAGDTQPAGGAADAHLHPQWSPAAPWSLWLGAAIIAVLAAFGSHVLAVDLSRVVLAGGPMTVAAIGLDSALGRTALPLLPMISFLPPDMVMAGRLPRRFALS